MVPLKLARNKHFTITKSFVSFFKGFVFHGWVWSDLLYLNFCILNPLLCLHLQQVQTGREHIAEIQLCALSMRRPPNGSGSSADVDGLDIAYTRQTVYADSVARSRGIGIKGHRNIPSLFYRTHDRIRICTKKYHISKWKFLSKKRIL